MIARLVEAERADRVVRRVHHRADRLGDGAEEREILPERLDVRAGGGGGDAEDVKRQRDVMRVGGFVHTGDEGRDRLRAMTIGAEHRGVAGDLHREAHVVELHLVGAELDDLLHQVDEVVLRLHVAGVDPAHRRRPARRRLDREPRPGRDHPRIVEARESRDDRDPALVREPYGAREVPDGSALPAPLSRASLTWVG